MKKRSIVTGALVLALLCAFSAQAEARTEPMDIFVSNVTGQDSYSGLNASEPVETLEKAGQLVADGGTIHVLDGAFINMSGFTTPAKAITITGGSIYSRGFMRLGGTLELHDIHLIFTDASIKPGPDERSIFCEGHDLTIGKNVTTENEGRYISVYAYEHGVASANNNQTIRLDSGTYEYVKAGAKKGSGQGHVNVLLSDDATVTTELSGGTGEETSTINLNPGYGVSPMGMSSRITGNGDVTLQNVKGKFGPVSFASIECNSLTLAENSDVLTYGPLSAKGDMSLPAGARLTIPYGSVEGKFLGGGALSLTRGALAISGMVSGETKLELGSFYDGFEAVSANSAGGGNFLSSSGSFTLESKAEEDRTIWWTDVPEPTPVTFDRVTIQTGALDYVDDFYTSPYPGKLAVSGESAVADYSVAFIKKCEDETEEFGTIEYEEMVFGVTAEAKISLPEDAVGVHILAQPDMNSRI